MRVSSSPVRISFRTMAPLLGATLALGLLGAGCGTPQEAATPQQTQQQDALTQGGLNAPTPSASGAAPAAAPSGK